MSDDNACPVCFEPLVSYSNTTAPDSNHEPSNNALGAVVPCGHCFHMNCFSIWRETKDRPCKCPSCSQVCQTFIKIFISPPKTDKVNGDYVEDDISLNSVETKMEQDADEDPDAKPSCGNKGHLPFADPQASSNHGDKSGDIVDTAEPPGFVGENRGDQMKDTSIVDVTQSPRLSDAKLPSVSRSKPAWATSSVRCSADADGSATTTIKKYKAIAKRYKRQYQQKQSQFREQFKLYQIVLSKQSKMDCDVNSLANQVLSLRELGKAKDVKDKGLSSERFQLKQQLDHQTKHISSLEEHNRNLQLAHDNLQKSLEKQIEQARSSSMAEVQQLKLDYHELLKDNERQMLQRNENIMELSRLGQAMTKKQQQE